MAVFVLFGGHNEKKQRHVAQGESLWQVQASVFSNRHEGTIRISLLLWLASKCVESVVGIGRGGA